MQIRTRFLLLVLAVWLPAVLAFFALARATYVRETGAVRDQVARLAENLGALIEQELDQRAVMARTLGSSAALAAGDLATFHREARAATRGSGTGDGGWVTLVTRDRQLLNTLVDFTPGMARPREAGLAFAERGPLTTFTPRGTVSGGPVITVLEPVVPPAGEPVAVDVGVSMKPERIQRLVEAQALPADSIASVVDGRHVILARTRDPARWLGQTASATMARRLERGLPGFADSTTLDGIDSTTYITAPNRFGWQVVLAVPISSLSRPAWHLTGQVLGVSGLLLAIGLAFALRSARRMGRPMLALREAAARLGRGEVPERLASGVDELDAVSAALCEAGRQAREASETLAQKVEAAVRETRQAQAKLLDGQKHEAIGRLTGGLAHDFNNLLQTISTALSVISLTAVAGQERVLKSAQRACAKGADLIRQMQAFGRQTALSPRPLDFADFILKCHELAAKAVGPDIRLEAHVEPGLPPVFADPVQLELALLNLIFNARDAMAAGGTIRIHAVRVTAEDASAAPDGGREPGPGFVRIDVVDTGHGMDAATAQRAVEPYFTTKPIGKGSGLGLAQVRAFARLSGGDLRIESRPGEGTTVRVTLPVATESVAPAAAAEPPAAPFRALRLLMVEDDTLVASVVVPALEAAGHAVVLAGSADQAIEALERGEPFDVVFTDIVMPGRRSGLDLAAWCREHRPGLRVVIATGYTAQAADVDLRVLRKPYELPVLLAALQEEAGEG